ncbi:hypothetical protein [Clostridium sp.]|uniref:hypothetical protein n=1 Tax=Clostridium sp. TaxID=1506 RepID=UPI0026730A50|nr:hypothetical protein [Clostridium sp.]MCI7030800.1 hypothetical protein [Clostridium sp.]
MPMYDTISLTGAGIPLSQKMLKYGNAVDQDGKIITPNPKDFNLQYDSLYNIMREQNMIETFERYMWTDIPFGLTQDIIERILFFRGKGIFYFNDKIEKFQFLPFALNGVIDEYGRYTRCNTLPFIGTDEEPKDKKVKKPRILVYEDLEIVYDLPYNSEMFEKARKMKTVGIILNDNSLAVSQQPIIRSNYVKPVLHMMATLMQIINTAMYGSADHNLLQIENESELVSIQNQINAINADILRGNRFTPIVGTLPITPLKTSNTANLEGLFGTFNSLTNFLKSITGIANAGVFDKKAHLLQEEQKLNGSNSDDIYYNGLRLRQEFCLMVQAYYNYPIWCESKRAMSEVQSENMMTGETTDPDNTQYNDIKGGDDNGNA